MMPLLLQPDKTIFSKLVLVAGAPLVSPVMLLLLSALDLSDKPNDAHCSWQQRHTEQRHLAGSTQITYRNHTDKSASGRSVVTSRWHSPICLCFQKMPCRASWAGKGCGRSRHSSQSHFLSWLHTRHVWQFHLLAVIAVAMPTLQHPWNQLAAPQLRTTNIDD